MPNYFINPADVGRQSVNTLAGAAQIAQSVRANELAERKYADQQQMQAAAVQSKFHQMKAQHISKIATSLIDMPSDVRSRKYGDLINRIAPAPIATHPVMGPLGASGVDQYIQPDEFVKLSEDQQKFYLRALAYDTGDFAALDLATEKGAIETQNILDRHKAKIAETFAAGYRGEKLESLKHKQKLEEQREAQFDRLELERERRQTGKAFEEARRKTEKLRQKGRVEIRETPKPEEMMTIPQDQIELLAAKMLRDGKMPKVGRGKRATAIREALLDSYSRQAMELGMGAGDLIGVQAQTTAIARSMNFQEKQLGAMGSFVRNMDAQILRVNEIAEEIADFDIRLLNIPRRQIVKRVKGSAVQARYEMYLAEIEGEIGKLAYGATASVAELSATAQEKWAKIHDKNLPISEMLKLLDETRHAGWLRMKSVEDQLAETRKRLTGPGILQAPAEPAAAPDTRTVWRTDGTRIGPVKTADDYLKKFRK